MNLYEFKELRYTSPMITHAYEPLAPYVQPNKVLVLYGPVGSVRRRCYRTTSPKRRSGTSSIRETTAAHSRF